jgi:MerR family copper efflux transcriptional regulator
MDRTRRAPLMTVGQLSQRTGVPIKALRQYADAGLVYTVGRSTANYRLFDSDALWCLRWIGILRGLGLTVAEIRELARMHLDGQPIGPRLAERLRAARTRLDGRIAELERIRRRIDEFEAIHQSELAGTGSNLWVDDPRGCTRRA